MNNIQIYSLATPPGSTQSYYYKLDILEGDPLKITLKITDEPGSVSSNYSQTFRIPSTENNEKVFKGACDLNNITFNPRRRIDTFISVNGSLFSQGFLTLENVVRNFYHDRCEYEVQYVGELADFKSKLGERYLWELDMNSLLHQRNISNIELSWSASTYGALEAGGSATAGFLNGNIIYPMNVEYGYEYTPQGVPDDTRNNTISSHDCGNSFLKNTTPLYQEQMKPLVRAKWVVDKIFDEAGFTYSSNFLTSNRFLPIYIAGDGLPRARTLPAGESKALLVSGFDYFAADNQYKDFRGGYPTQIIQSPNLLLTGDEAGQYEVGLSGTYGVVWDSDSVRSLVEFDTPGGTKVVRATYQVELFNFTTQTQIYAWTADQYTFSVISPVAQVSYSSYRNFPFTTFTYSAFLTVGDKVGLRNRMKFEITSGTGGFRDRGTGFQARSFIQHIYPTSVGNKTVGVLLSRKMRQIDFISSLAKKFNLVIEPDPFDKKKLKIETWNDWIQGGEKKDWSKKLDGSSDFTFVPIFQDRKKILTLTDTKDTDWPNVLFETKNKYTYGRYKLNSDIETLDGEEVIETGFSPTIMVSYGICGATTPPDEGDRRFAILSISSDDNPENATLGQRKPIEATPRLCFWNGTQSWNPNPPGSSHWHLYNDAGTGHNQYSYTPAVSNFQYYPGTTTSTNFDINFNGEIYLNYLDGLWPQTSNTSFDYWRDWINLYYDRPFNGFNNRKAKCKLYLTDEDILGFQFNTKVFIANTWWLVSEISNYNLGKGGLTDVELIQLGYTNIGL